MLYNFPSLICISIKEIKQSDIYEDLWCRENETSIQDD
jgi:hypothetical protein